MGVAKRVLVIGKNSYLASSMMEYCRTHPLSDIEISFDAVGARDGAWRQVDFSVYNTVILFAGIAHRKAEASQYDQVNHKMAVDVAAYAKQCQVRQFILMSTIAVHGSRIVMEGGEPCIAPETDYAKSKWMAEQEIKAMETDLFGVAVIRPPMVYGAGCPGNFFKLVHLIQKVHMYPKYRNQRSSIYIDHLSAFLQQVIGQSLYGTFVPQDGQYLSSDEIAIALRAKQHILLIRGCRPLIRLGMKCSRQMKKMFGDYCYPLELSRYEHIEYQQYDTKEAILRSLE